MSHPARYHTPWHITHPMMSHPARCHSPRDNKRPRNATPREMSHLSPLEMSHPHSRSHIPRDVTPRGMSHTREMSHTPVMTHPVVMLHAAVKSHPARCPQQQNTLNPWHAVKPAYDYAGFFIAVKKRNRPVLVCPMHKP